ncbi:MAG: hypothetical protein ACRD2Q_08765, partial [Terriglobales bacterium]
MGFLTVSIHHARYGIVQYELFRARIFSAGILFSIFLILALLTGARAFGLLSADQSTTGPSVASKLGPFTPSYRLLVGTLTLTTYSLVLGFFTGVFFKAEKRHVEAFWQSLAVYVGVIVYTAFVSTIIEQRFEKTPGRCTILAMVTGVAALSVVSRLGGLEFFLRTLWFGVVGGLVLYIYPPPQDLRELRELNWHLWLINSVLVITVFALLLYPLIRAELGGGAPVPVVVQLSSGPTIDPQSRIRGLLLDETESGFYIIPSKEGTG